MLFDLRAARLVGGDPRTSSTFRRDILPPVFAAGRARRRACTAAAAAATGLARRARRCSSAAPTRSARCSVPARSRPATSAATLGTTTPVQTVVGRRRCSIPAANLWAGCHVVPDRWVIESNAGDTGDAYLWLLDLVGAGRTATATRSPRSWRARERRTAARSRSSARASSI